MSRRTLVLGALLGLAVALLVWALRPGPPGPPTREVLQRSDSLDRTAPGDAAGLDSLRREGARRDSLAETALARARARVPRPRPRPREPDPGLDADSVAGYWKARWGEERRVSDSLRLAVADYERADSLRREARAVLVDSVSARLAARLAASERARRDLADALRRAECRVPLLGVRCPTRTEAAVGGLILGGGAGAIIAREE